MMQHRDSSHWRVYVSLYAQDINDEHAMKNPWIGCITNEFEISIHKYYFSCTSLEVILNARELWLLEFDIENNNALWSV